MPGRTRCHSHRLTTTGRRRRALASDHPETCARFQRQPWGDPGTGRWALRTRPPPPADGLRLVEGVPARRLPRGVQTAAPVGARRRAHRGHPVGVAPQPPDASCRWRHPELLRDAAWLRRRSSGCGASRGTITFGPLGVLRIDRPRSMRPWAGSGPARSRLIAFRIGDLLGGERWPGGLPWRWLGSPHHRQGSQCGGLFVARLVFLIELSNRSGATPAYQPPAISAAAVTGSASTGRCPSASPAERGG